MSSKRILIVEDNDTIRLTLAQTIKKLARGYQVEAVADGITAMAVLYQQPFDLMIADYKMPGITGLELSHKVRQVLPDMPIVLMSAQDIFELQAQAQDRELPIDGFLQKPIVNAQLQEIIQRLGQL